MKETFKIYGSDEDLHAFGKMFKDGGFDKCKDDPSPSIMQPGMETMGTFPADTSIKYEVAPGIGNCIKKILAARHQHLVATGKDGKQIKIRGDLSANEIERLLKCSRSFYIVKELS